MMMVSEEDQLAQEAVVIDAAARATMTRQEYLEYQLNKMTLMLLEAIERARMMREERLRLGR